MIRDRRDVIVVGAAIAGFETLDGEVVSSVFDDDTDSWALTTRDGETCHARVVICESPLVPWIPDLPGRNEFRGVSLHAAAPGRRVDAIGKRVAVIGADTAAGALIEQLTTTAASITVFPYPPRRVIPQARRWWRRRTSTDVVTSPIDTVTKSGIRTSDGADHDIDVIVYGTGFSVEDNTLVGTHGLTIQQACDDGMEPYLGIAIHGFPNYFFVRRPDITASMRWITQCLRFMEGHTRIEVRRSSQQVFNERVHVHRPRYRLTPSAFDRSSTSSHDDVYDGPATLRLPDTSQEVRVRLTGHVDPIDGQYHWQGTVFGQLPADLLKQARAVTLAVDGRRAPARITEETPQGRYSVAGVGAPPFALDVDVTVPQA